MFISHRVVGVFRPIEQCHRLLVPELLCLGDRFDAFFDVLFPAVVAINEGHNNWSFAREMLAPD